MTSLSSFESLVEMESFLASAIFPFKDDAFSSHSQVERLCSWVPHDSNIEVAELRLLLEVHEQSLADRTNQVVKLMADIELKDHQLALKDGQLELRDHHIADLEAYLVSVHESQRKKLLLYSPLLGCSWRKKRSV
jgi:hypothetical protein